MMSSSHVASRSLRLLGTFVLAAWSTIVHADTIDDAISQVERGECSERDEKTIDNAITRSSSTRLLVAKSLCRAFSSDFSLAITSLQKAIEVEQDKAKRKKLQEMLDTWRRADIVTKAQDEANEGKAVDGAKRIDTWFKSGGRRCPSMLAAQAFLWARAEDIAKSATSARAALASKCPDDALTPSERAGLFVVLGAVALQKKQLSLAEGEAKKALRLVPEDSAVAADAHGILIAVANTRPAAKRGTSDSPPVTIKPDIRTYQCSMKCSVKGHSFDIGQMRVNADGHMDAWWQASAKVKSKGVCREGSFSADCNELR